MHHTKSIILCWSTSDYKSCISLNTGFSAVGQLPTEWIGVQHDKAKLNVRSFLLETSGTTKMRVAHGYSAIYYIAEA